MIWNDTYIVLDCLSVFPGFKLIPIMFKKRDETLETVRVSRGCGGETETDEVRRLFRATVIILTDRPASCEPEPRLACRRCSHYTWSSLIWMSHSHSLKHTSASVCENQFGWTADSGGWLTDHNAAFFFFLPTWYNPLITVFPDSFLPSREAQSLVNSH